MCKINKYACGQVHNLLFLWIDLYFGLSKGKWNNCQFDFEMFLFCLFAQNQAGWSSVKQQNIITTINNTIINLLGIPV